MKRTLIGGMVVLIGAGSMTALAADTPGWRGAARDGHVAGFEAPAEWPDALEKGWSVEVGTGHATPALVGDRLYVHARQGEQEVALCLEAGTGKELWRDAYDAPFEMDPTATEHGKGPKSSPVVADGRVYTFGITSVLTCYAAADGKVVWRERFDALPKAFPRYGTAMSPLVASGVCIVHVGDKDKGSIVALDAKTGEKKWSWDGDGPGYASPVLAKVGDGEQLITQTHAHVVGLSAADGKELWKLEFKTNYDQNSVTPVVAGDLLVISGYKNGTLAFRLGEGAPEPAWDTTKVSMYMSTPVAHDGKLYGLSEKRRGQYFCLDLANGDALWTSDGREVESAGNAALWLAGEVVLALTTGSELVAFRASPDDYEELARWEVAESPTWAHPVIDGKTIYIKDEKALTRWSLP